MEVSYKFLPVCLWVTPIHHHHHHRMRPMAFFGAAVLALVMGDRIGAKMFGIVSYAFYPNELFYYILQPSGICSI